MLSAMVREQRDDERVSTTGSGAMLVVRVPGIHGGEPVVRGTRVSVRSVVIAYERYKGDVDRVARAFLISADDVRGALAFYESHRAEIDAYIEMRDRDASA
jgi:uncharacterized protein (DUF433 family)